jgi:adhesin transport system outer membrane protein
MHEEKVHLWMSIQNAASMSRYYLCETTAAARKSATRVNFLDAGFAADGVRKSLLGLPVSARGAQINTGIGSMLCAAVLAMFSFQCVAQPLATTPQVSPRPKTTVLPLRAAAIGDRMNESLMSRVRTGDAGSIGTLRQLAREVLTAVDSHPAVLAITEQVGLAQSVVTEARSGWYPQVSASVDGGNRRATSPADGGVTVNTQEGLGYGASVRQLVYDFGTTNALVGSARSREQAASVRLQTMRSDVALRALLAWLELERARQLRELAEDNLGSRTDIVDLVRERFEVGGSSRADLIRAEARRADAQATQVAAEIALRSAVPAYREAFGRDPEQTGLPAELPIALKGQTSAQLAERFGGVREIKALLESNRADAVAADGRTKPVFNIEVNGNRREQSIGGLPLVESSALLVMRYNLFTGNADSARREQAIRRVNQTEQDLASLIRQIERNIEQAQAQVYSAEALIQSRRTVVRAASESLIAVKEQFAFNRGTLLDLLRVQEDLYNAGRDLINASIDSRISQYRLINLISELEPRLTDVIASTLNR